MILNIKHELVGQLRDEGFPIPEPSRNWEREGSSVQVDLREWDLDVAERFCDFLKQVEGSEGLRRRISSWRKASADPENSKVMDLGVLEAALQSWLMHDAIEGWLFPIQDEPAPALIVSIKYREAEDDYPAEVTMTLRRQTDAGGYQHEYVAFRGDDIKGQTLANLLIAKGWQKETDELLDAYRVAFEKWQKLADMFGKQLKLTAPMSYHAVDWRHWSRDSREVDLMTLGGGKVVVDNRGAEERSHRSGISGSSRRTRGRDGWEMRELLLHHGVMAEESSAFTVIPYLLTIRCFHLEAHTHINPHVDRLEVYEYDTTIREKLILPETQMTLLDVLTEEMQMVQEDIIEGKTGGNVVLLTGRPGLGKTLTAEVYAEHRQVPLYKVHSGQLGTNAEKVEETLQAVYQRAARWGDVIILLDEFDVFGRERADNLEQNAIVAVFLRTLEYQNNTIFLTTNRHEDMDDAILSRCAAIIAYLHPKGETLENMWKTMRDQYLPSLEDSVIQEVAPKYEGLSGRDIKLIMRLAAKYERRGTEVSAELLGQCALFRGIQEVQAG